MTTRWKYKTRMLCAALKKSCQQNTTKKQLWGHLPLITKIIQDEQNKQGTAEETKTNS